MKWPGACRLSCTTMLLRLETSSSRMPTSDISSQPRASGRQWNPRLEIPLGAFQRVPRDGPPLPRNTTR